MTKHVFNIKENGVRRVYAGNANDEVFDRLFRHLGGVLPPNVVVTHLDDDETVANSPRVRIMAKWPRAERISHAIGGDVVTGIMWTELFPEFDLAGAQE